MKYLAVISLTASILYFYVGLHALKANPKSRLCNIFFLLNLCMTIWSFGDSFVYLAVDIYEYSFWNKVAAFGWCTFEAFVLYFVLVLIENKQIRHWYIKLLILSPAMVFLCMVLFLFGPDLQTSNFVRTFFNIGNFAYNFSYLATSIVLISIWGYRSDSKIRKKQALIISISSLLPFILNLIVQYVLPALHIIKLPYIGQILTLIMLLGVYYAITRYQFMSIPSSMITNELFHELNGLTFLTDPQGIIMKANKKAYELLTYEGDELTGKYITKLLDHPDILRIMMDCEVLRERVRLKELEINSRSGELLPINVSIVPLFIDPDLLGGILFVCEDIRANKRLKDEIEKHTLTNKKLKNSEMMFRNILERAPISIVLTGKGTGTVLYLNSYAEELFGAVGMDLVGSHVSEYIALSANEQALTESLNRNERISNREIELNKKDGTRFTGLVTIIPSVYYEQEVALSCIIDITEQKRTADQLKEYNNHILELNRELMEINTVLKNKSIKDGLTNLYNHQYINEVLEAKITEYPMTGERLCLMMMDIDHFKQINDKYGHPAGDTILQTISGLLIRNTREQDITGRYGGEEFIVILPDITLEKAAELAEKLRLAVYQYDYGIEHRNISISIGVTLYQGESVGTFINRADMLLYQAKANGRNRVETEL